jgi:hypothetical protein
MHRFEDHGSHELNRFLSLPSYGFVFSWHFVRSAFVKWPPKSCVSRSIVRSLIPFVLGEASDFANGSAPGSDSGEDRFSKLRSEKMRLDWQ